jgi:hypothetical protein
VLWMCDVVTDDVRDEPGVDVVDVHMFTSHRLNTMLRRRTRSGLV